MACGIFPDQGPNPCLLHWQADSLPLSHQGSPILCPAIKTSKSLLITAQCPPVGKTGPSCERHRIARHGPGQKRHRLGRGAPGLGLALNPARPLSTCLGLLPCETEAALRLLPRAPPINGTACAKNLGQKPAPRQGLTALSRH